MSSGKEIKAAFKKASAWGTAAACASGDVLLITGEKINQSIEHLPDDSAGQAFHADRDRGLITCSGELSAYLRYQGLGVLLALALGAAGSPSAHGASGFDHQLRMAGDLDGLFGTLAVYKGFSVHEFASAKVDGFTIEGQAGQPLTASFSLICDGRSINTDSGANTNATMAALSAPATGNRVLFRQGAFMINDAEGDALDSGDVITPSRFSLSLRRGLAGDHLAGGEDKIAEPAHAAFPELSLSLEFPTYTSDTYLSDLGSDARKKMRIDFIGGEIESGVNYAFSLIMPHVVITNAEAAVDGAGKIAHPISASLLATATQRSGMSGITGPLAIDLTNTRATDLLA
ncbi:MAG: phage tail tube protein [Thermodesulfobacteriota bacterium]